MNNPPAFPSNVWWETGMTLRDYFAAKAMQAMIGNELDCTTDALAGRAYVVADAMLKAREA